MTAAVYPFGLPGSPLPATPAATPAEEAEEIHDYYVEHGIEPAVAFAWAAEEYLDEPKHRERST